MMYEHEIDAANARIQELEAENAELVVAARLAQKTADRLRAENANLVAGKSLGSEAAAKVAADLEAWRNAPLEG